MIRTICITLLSGVAIGVVAQGNHRVDPGATKLTWVGKKVTGQHHGSIQVQEGSVRWGADGLAAAEVTIDMGSIKDLDMDGESAARLERHLRSDDFFGTARFKTATFKTTRVEKIAGAAAGQPNYTVTGDLTIKGIAKPITFGLRAWQEDRSVRAVGTAVFDRTHYGIEYRSGSIFDALGDKMIDDLVELRFDLVAR